MMISKMKQTRVKLMMLSLPLSGPLYSQPFLVTVDTKPRLRVSCRERYWNIYALVVNICEEVYDIRGFVADRRSEKNGFKRKVVLFNAIFVFVDSYLFKPLSF